MTTAWESMFKRLADEELILPYFESALLADNWPQSYQVTVDSSPYYGRGDGYFHPSTHPLMPARRLYYMMHPDFADKVLVEPTTVQREITLAVHSSIHAVVQTQMKMANLVTEDNIEVEYRNEKHKVRGRIDFVVDHPKVGKLPVELKGQNPYSFRNQKEIKPEWDAQLSIALDNYGTDLGVLLVLETGWPYRLKEYRVEKNTELVKQCYDKFDLVRQAIADNNPPRDCCGLTAEGSACRSRFLCFPQEAT